MKLYRKLVRLVPSRFRLLYGDEMVRLRRERLERSRREGRWQWASAVFTSYADLAWTIVLEGRETLRRRKKARPRGPRKEAAFVRLIGHMRFSMRSLARQPTFVGAVVLTLALGTGITLALFAIADATVLRPLPYPEPDRLVSIVQDTDAFGLVPFAAPYLEDLRERTTSFETIVGFSSTWTLKFSGAGAPRFVEATYVSDGTLELLGAGLVAGRGLVRGDFSDGASAVVLVTRSFWESEFGRVDAFEPRDVRLDDGLFTIVGIVPSSVRMPITTSVVSRRSEPADVFLPWAAHPWAALRAVPVMNVVARFRDDVSLASAVVELNAVGETLRSDFPETSRSDVTGVLLAELVTRGSRRTVWTLFGAAAFLFLIACANVANLLLARASGRETEMAIRFALGARRGQVTAELIAEGLLLATAGVGAGLALAWAIVIALPSVGLAGVPPSATIRIDPAVTLFAILLTVVTAVGFGLVPAISGSHPEPGASRATNPGVRARALLVGAEIAITFCLLVGAALLLRSFWNLLHVDPGFRAAGLVQAPLDLRSDAYRAPERAEFVAELRRRVQSMPTVSAAGVVNRLPLAGSNVFVRVDMEGASTTDDEFPAVDRRVMSPGYLRTMAIPVVDGRDFDTRDHAEAPRVAIVNEALATRFWPDGAVGRRVRLELRSGLGPWLTVVGVCGDVRHHGLDAPAKPELYVPYAQSPVESAVLIARTSADVDTAVSLLSQQVWTLDDTIPLDPAGSVSRIVRESVAVPRFRMLVLNGFAALALVLAAIGIYSVMAYTVTSETREIGLRIAIGAESRCVVRDVVRRGILVAAWGVLAGVAGSVALSRLLRGLLFEVTPTDPATLAIVSGALLVVATIASYVPARRASKIDPVAALRLD